MSCCCEKKKQHFVCRHGHREHAHRVHILHTHLRCIRTTVTSCLNLETENWNRPALWSFVVLCFQNGGDPAEHVPVQEQDRPSEAREGRAHHHLRGTGEFLANVSFGFSVRISSARLCSLLAVETSFRYHCWLVFVLIASFESCSSRQTQGLNCVGAISYIHRQMLSATFDFGSK